MAESDKTVTLLKVIYDNPILSFCAIWLLIMLVLNCWKYWLNYRKFLLRARNIEAQGWPPPHLDADGDFRQCGCQDEAAPESASPDLRFPAPRSVAHAPPERHRSGESPSRLSGPSPAPKDALRARYGAKKRPPGGGLTERLLPILRRAGYVVPGHPAWRDPAELEEWFAAPRAELGGRAWAQVHVPFTLEARMRFAAAMDQIDREIVEVPA
jgi:hypothetical protein